MKTFKLMSQLLAVVGLLTVFMTFGLAENECSDIVPKQHQFTETGSGANYSDSWTGLNEGVNKYYYFTAPSQGYLTFTRNSNSNIVYRYSFAECPTGDIGTVLENGSMISLDTDKDFNLRILSNADNQNTNFTLAFVSTETPEIDVVGVADGGADTSYGSTSVGNSIDRTYTIKNTGGATLTLQNPTTTGDFSIINAPASSVPAGSTTTFTVRFKPTATGNRTGTVSFVNNDSDENPYNFTLTGTGTAPEAKVVGNGREIVDGDTSPTTADYTNLGSATLGGFIERTYTIQNTGSVPLSVGSVTKSGGTGASYFTVIAQPASTVAPNSSTTFKVKYTASVTGTFTTNLSFNTNDSNENPYNFTIQGSDIAPEAKVTGKGKEILDGDTTPATEDFTDFGNVKAGASLEKTYIIYNTGTSAMSVGTVTLGGVAAGSFSVTSQPATSVVAGGNTQFKVKYSPSSSIATDTIQNATISFGNNDANENPYNFSIKATGVVPEAKVTGNSVEIPDGDTTPATTDYTDFGNVTTGSSSTKRYYIYNTGKATLTVGTPTISGANASDYTITRNPSATVPAGGSTYFEVKFIPSANGVRNAKVSFVNDDPNEKTYDFTIKGTGATPEIEVRASNKTTVIPDGDTTPVTTDGTDFGNVVLGAYVDKTFYIYNTGEGTLTVGALTLPAGFSIVGAMPTSVNAGYGKSFVVRYNPTTPGATSGTLSFVNSDSNENPYDFTIAGNARAELPNEGSPLESAKLVEGVCDVFADMFQTHALCSGGSSTVNFNDNAKPLDGSNNYILNNTDNTLNTCDVTAASQVTSNYQTCGVPGDCEETGTPAVSLNLDYSNTPTLDTISATPSSSTTNKTLSVGATYSEGIDYNTLSVNNANSQTFTFKVDYQLKINTITFMNDDKIVFKTIGSSKPYSLDIGKINFTGSGVNNDIYANDKFAKNIKVNSILLGASTDINFEATQTIKIGSLQVNEGSTVTLKAPYVQLGALNVFKNNSKSSRVIIIADHIDIGSLDLRKNNGSYDLDLEVWPYSPNTNVLFRANSINESNSPRMYLSQGAYYTGTWTTSGDASGVPVAQATNADSMIDFYVNSNLYFGSQSGINTDGTKNYGSKSPLNFKLFVNGNVTFGGGDNTINATVYATGNFTSNHDTYIRGAVSASKVDIQGGQYTYDQGIDGSIWGACSEPPVAVDDNVTIDQNTPTTIPVLANDTGDKISLDSNTSPSHGTLKVEADGTITYTPHTGFVGSDHFTYTIKDTDNQKDTANVNITVVVPLPADETIYTVDPIDLRGECVFPDMFQTFTTCGTTKVNFSVAPNPIDGSNHYIVENEDRRLYTCSIEASDAVTSASQTCGAYGDCVALGKSSDPLTGIEYKEPRIDIVSNTPTSGETLLLATSQTVSGYDYDKLSVTAIGVTTDFNITRKLSINTIEPNDNSVFNFAGTEPYALHIGTFSSDPWKKTATTVQTDSNAKNIKINEMLLRHQRNDIHLKAQQTIRVSSLETYQYSTVRLEAPYVQLQLLTAYDRTQIIIKADVVDIGTLLLFHGSDEVNTSLTTVKFEPYTAGGRVVFRTYGVVQEHNMQLLLSAGDYYMSYWSTKGDTVGTSLANVINATAVVNIIDNSGGMAFNRNASLNANGIKDFGSNPPANFRLFLPNARVGFGDNGFLGTNTLNATLYAKEFTGQNNTYVKGAISTGGDITLNGGQYFYDQTGNEIWKVCPEPLDAVDDNVTTRKNLSKTIDVLINDISYCQTPSPYATTFPLTTTQGGTVSLEADNTLSYTPPVDFKGVDSFNYMIKDKKTCTETDTAKVTINVVEVVAVDDCGYTVEENSTISIPVRGNDTPQDATVSSVGSPACGQVSIVDNQIYFETQGGTRNCTREDDNVTFDYTITDAYGYHDTAKVCIDVVEYVVEDADDLCYEEVQTDGMFCLDMGICSGGMGCKNSYPIKNIGDATLKETQVIFNEDTLGFSFSDDCGVDPVGQCDLQLNVGFGGFGNFGSATVYDFGSDIPVQNNSNKFWMKSFIGFNCFTSNDIFASYRKNGVLHKGRLKPCETEFQTTEGYREFELRKQTFVKGDMKTIGNTVLVAPEGSDTENKCSTYTNEPFIDNAPEKNEDYYLCGYHSDGLNALNFTNSTQATLDISDDAVVVWAGLYWQGIVAGEVDGNMTIKLAKEGSAYVDVPVQILDRVTPTPYKTPSGGKTSNYAAFADVTEYFGKDKWNKGTYTVANVPAYEGKIEGLGSYGAWSLVTIYEDKNSPTEKYRSISVYDGWKIISPDTGKVSINVKDFFTPNRPDINANISVFAAEGDKTISGDTFKTTNYNTNNTDFLGANPNNAFDSSISGGFTRTPHPINNNGIDIQTHDIGEDMAPKQSEMKFTFQSELDVFYPSMLAFATEVYMPKLCYDYTIRIGDSIAVPSTNRAFNIAGWDGGDPLIISTLIRSQESDFDLIKTSMNLEFDSIGLVFDGSNTRVAPPRINSYLTPEILDSSSGRVSIGAMPWSGGGTIGALESTYAKMAYDLEANVSHPSAMSFNMILKTVLNLPGATIPIELTTATGVGTDGYIDKCPANSVYSPIIGTFNIENSLYPDFSAPATERYPLFTQITGRPYSVYIRSYGGANFDQEQVISDTTVEIEIIDAGTFDNNATAGYDSKCEEPTSFNDGAMKYFDNVSQVKVDIPNDFGGYATNDTALQNAAFRLWILTKLEQNGTKVVVPHNCTDQTDEACFRNVYNEYYATLDATSKYCKEDCSVSGSGCYACLKKYFASPICSRDNFAIRPNGFRVEVRDGNATSDANATTSVFVANNNANTTRQPISAGYDYLLDINATSSNGTPSRGYYSDKFQAGKGADINATDTTIALLEFEDSTSCADQNDTSYAIKFQNSKIQGDANALSHDNVGKYKFWMQDVDWTFVDQARNPNKTIFNPDCRTDVKKQECNDCILSSSDGINIKPGCVTSSKVDNDNTYTDIPLQIQPFAFDVSRVVMNQPVGVGFAYTSDINTTNPLELAQSPHFGGNVIAINRQGNFVSNFASGCASSDVSFDINRTMRLDGQSVGDLNITTITPNLFTGNNIFMQRNAFERIGTNHYDAVIPGDINLTFTIGAGDFDINATAPVNVYYNFQKNLRNTHSPIDVTFQVSRAISPQARSNTFMRNDYIPEGNNTLNARVWYYYGRIVSEEANYGIEPTQDTITVPIYVEVYCDPLVADCASSGLTLPSKRNASRWWINTQHVSATHGLMQTIAEVSGGSITITPKADNVDLNGDGNQTNITLTLNSGTIKPYNSIIQITPNMPWLLYNPFSTDNSDRPDFSINFLFGGGWGGLGNTGVVLDTNASYDSYRKRIEW